MVARLYVPLMMLWTPNCMGYKNVGPSIYVMCTVFSTDGVYVEIV